MSNIDESASSPDDISTVCGEEKEANANLNDFDNSAERESSSEYSFDSDDECDLTRINRKEYTLNSILKQKWAKNETEKRKKKRNMQRRNRYYKGREVKKRQVKQTVFTGIYIHDGRVYCFEHSELIKYWCENCRTYRCGECTNLVYGKTCVNHKQTPLHIHAPKIKALQQENVQKTSASCLHSVDLLLKYINLDQEQVEFQALSQKERIRQEFISFHQLLIEEEHKTIKFLDESLENHTINNKLIEEGCGKLIGDEAELMCKTLENLQVDDLNSIIVEDVSNLILKDWQRLNMKTKELTVLIQRRPDIIHEKVSFNNMKTMVERRLRGVTQPVQIVPVSFTVFLDGRSIVSPIKVSDLYSFGNSAQFEDVSNILFDMEIHSTGLLLQKLRLRYNDYVCNHDQRIYLMYLHRYRVKAKILGSTEQSRNCTDPGRNVLIVTGILHTQLNCDVKRSTNSAISDAFNGLLRRL